VAEELRAALVVLTRDDEVRATLTAELDRRYGRDYAVVACDPGEAGDQLAGGDLPVAALFSCLGGADPDGLTTLRQLHRDHAGAMAVAVVRWGDFDTARPIFDAVTLGQLDRWLYVPELVGDEEFLAASDALAADERTLPMVRQTLLRANDTLRRMLVARSS